MFTVHSTSHNRNLTPVYHNISDWGHGYHLYGAVYFRLVWWLSDHLWSCIPSDYTVMVQWPPLWSCIPSDYTVMVQWSPLELYTFRLVYDGSVITSMELYTFRLVCDGSVITSVIELYTFRLVCDGSVITSMELYYLQTRLMVQWSPLWSCITFRLDCDGSVITSKEMFTFGLDWGHGDHLYGTL